MYMQFSTITSGMSLLAFDCFEFIACGQLPWHCYSKPWRACGLIIVKEFQCVGM